MGVCDFSIIEVYPRACGGTARAELRHDGVEGLSPRVRGNRPKYRSDPMPRGSIPARAGEPPSIASTTWALRVYPRACGGTIGVDANLAFLQGLSPRVRGNHRCRCKPRLPPGSIPARAGEPLPRGTACGREVVYPRACGGTKAIIDALTDTPGLSPRVRGNPHEPDRDPDQEGSIPARAGEPCSRPPSSPWRRVYPRACGGTPGASACPALCQGLSPRVRGNPAGEGEGQLWHGSIPARAGEPFAQDCTAS